MMRRTLATYATIIISLTLFLIPNSSFGLEIKKVESISLENTNDLNIIPRSFCKTKQGTFLIPNHEDGVIKVFQRVENSLVYRDKFGPRGSSIDTEFLNISPSFCFYNSNQSKFGFLDVDEKKVYLFNQCRAFDFILDGTVENVKGNVKLNEDGTMLIVADYTTDDQGNEYELYSLGVSSENKGEKLNLVPILEKYGYKNDDNGKKNFNQDYEEGKIPAIGTKALFDVYKDNIYFMWEGKLRLVKINLVTGESSVLIDSPQKVKQYKEPMDSQPKLLEKLIENYNLKNIEEVLTLKREMSYIRDVFVTSNHIFIVFRGGENGATGHFRLLAYSMDGALLGNVPIPGNYYQRMWFDKDKYEIFSLSQQSRKGEKKDSCL